MAESCCLLWYFRPSIEAMSRLLSTLGLSRAACGVCIKPLPYFEGLRNSERNRSSAFEDRAISKLNDGYGTVVEYRPCVQWAYRLGAASGHSFEFVWISSLYTLRSEGVKYPCKLSDFQRHLHTLAGRNHRRPHDNWWKDTRSWAHELRAFCVTGILSLSPWMIRPLSFLVI